MFQYLVIPIAVLLLSVSMSRLMRAAGSLPGLMGHSGGGRVIPQAGVTVIRISLVAALALMGAGGPGQRVVGQEIESTEADDKVESGTVDPPAGNPPPEDPPVERTPVEETGVESLLTPFVEPLVGESETGDATGDPEDPVEAARRAALAVDPELVEDLEPDEIIEPATDIRAAGTDEPTTDLSSLSAASTGFLSAGNRTGPGWGGTLAKDFKFTAYSEAAYETKPSFGYGAGGREGGDFYLILGGSVGYERKVGDLVLDLEYYGDYQRYFQQDELSNDFHEGNLSVQYAGGAVTAGLSAKVSNGSGANAYYQSIIDQIHYGINLTGSYRLSPLTEFRAGYALAVQDATAKDSALVTVHDTRNQTFNLDALWSYSPLLSIGPGLRVAERSGSRNGGLTSVGPSLNLSYRATTLISANATTALNWFEFPSGESGDPMLSASIGASYRPSRFWSLNLGVSRDLVADPVVVESYSERTSLKVGFQREIARNTLSVGFSYSMDHSTSAVGALRGDREYYTLSASLSRKVLGDSELTLFANFRDLSGASGTGSASSDSAVIGLSLNHNF